MEFANYLIQKLISILNEEKERVKVNFEKATRNLDPSDDFYQIHSDFADEEFEKINEIIKILEDGKVAQ